MVHFLQGGLWCKESLQSIKRSCFSRCSLCYGLAIRLAIHMKCQVQARQVFSGIRGHDNSLAFLALDVTSHLMSHSTMPCILKFSNNINLFKLSRSINTGINNGIICILYSNPREYIIWQNIDEYQKQNWSQN